MPLNNQHASGKIMRSSAQSARAAALHACVCHCILNRHAAARQRHGTRTHTVFYVGDFNARGQREVQAGVRNDGFAISNGMGATNEDAIRGGLKTVARRTATKQTYEKLANSKRQERMRMLLSQFAAHTRALRRLRLQLHGACYRLPVACSTSFWNVL